MPRKNFGLNLDEATMARLRAACEALGRPEAPGPSAVVDRLIVREVERLERKFNEGRPFPVVEQLPPGGRRPG